MKGLEAILAEHAFFAQLAPRYLDLLVGCARNVRFDPATFIAREGDEAGDFFLIRHGTVSLELHVPQHGPRVLQTLGPGDILGWSWLIPPHRWCFDVRATALTRAIALDGKCLRTKCEEDHDLGYELLKRFSHVLSQRLEATRLQLLDVYGTAA